MVRESRLSVPAHARRHAPGKGLRVGGQACGVPSVVTRELEGERREKWRSRLCVSSAYPRHYLAPVAAQLSCSHTREAARHSSEGVPDRVAAGRKSVEQRRRRAGTSMAAGDKSELRAAPRRSGRPGCRWRTGPATWGGPRRTVRGGGRGAGQNRSGPVSNWQCLVCLSVAHRPADTPSLLQQRCARHAQIQLVRASERWAKSSAARAGHGTSHRLGRATHPLAAGRGAGSRLLGSHGGGALCDAEARGIEGRRRQGKGDTVRRGPARVTGHIVVPCRERHSASRRWRRSSSWRPFCV